MGRTIQKDNVLLAGENLQQWLNTVGSCVGQLENGSEEKAEDALSLLRAISPYTEGWKTQYDRWHRELLLSNAS